jgi:pimeloyl-ACP methyl ester carboxylesterase
MAKQLLSSEDSDQKAQIMRQRKAIQIFKFEELDPSLIKIPTLVIHGEKDGVISVEAAIDIASRINGSLRHIYPDTGHLILAEKPSEFYSDVISFFTSQNG